MSFSRHREEIKNTVEKGNKDSLFEEYLLSQIEELKRRNRELESLVLEYERAIDASSSYKTLMEVAQDLIELKRAEEALKKERDYFKNVLDNSADAIGIVDAKGRFIRWNKRAEELFGYSFEELKGKSAFDLYYDKEALEEMLKQLRCRGYVRDYEITVRTKSGSLLPMGMSISVLKEEDKVIGSVCVARDLTQIKQVQKDLEKSKEEAEAASRAKSEFLANISHEIRTPMNAILGFAETLLNETVNERHRRFLQTILSSGQNLLALIDDILDLSRIEAGKLKIQPEPVDIKAMVYEIHSIFLDKAEKKGLEFLLKIDKDLPEILILDEVRLRQILMNLISNAIKFTDRGRVELHLWQKLCHVNTIDLFIRVLDTGIGIPPSQHQLIFENFRQQDNQRAKDYGGTGLGLAITKKLVELMEGEIWVESEVGKGSIFTVRLPRVVVGADKLSQKEGEGEEGVSHVYFKGGRVLIVDDVSSNIEVIKSFLEDRGVEVWGAVSSMEADHIISQRNFNVIFMDLRMPEEDGFSYARRLREDRGTKDIPIIAVTAVSLKDREREVEELFDGYILKPVTRIDIISQLMRFLPFEYHGEEEVKRKVIELGQVPSPFKQEIKQALGEFFQDFSGAFEIEGVKEVSTTWRKVTEKYHLSSLKDMASQLDQAISAFDISRIKDLLYQIKRCIWD